MHPPTVLMIAPPKLAYGLIHIITVAIRNAIVPSDIIP
jgi:hypothetical protein